ncbi:MAG: tRNA (guanine-N7)-methyltransferase [Myxococcota bacterium]|nr:tRNA (guanine-N7)-methyltransferase [Myxococcota bacterium]
MESAEILAAAAGDGAILLDEIDLPPGLVDVRERFGCSRPADLDVGFGKGLSLREWAAARPHGTLLGIEKRRGFALYAAARLDAPARARVRALRGDFRALAPRLRPDGFFRACSINFPDPWWKRRHQKRQVVCQATVDEIARLLEPGGELLLQTDVVDRAERFREAFTASGQFDDAAGPGSYLPANPTGVRSDREVRCEREGLVVYRLVFRRRPVRPAEACRGA